MFKHVVIDTDGPLNPHAKIAGDVNGDGRDEFVVSSSSGGPLVWYDLKTLARHVICPAGEWSCDAMLVDMNGSGHPDLLISEWYGQNRIEWFENPLPGGDPTAPWKRHVIGPPRAHDICLGDVDGDGELEIVTRDQGGEGLRIHVCKRDGDEWRRREFACPTGEGLAVADLTGNGRADIVIGDRWYEAPEDAMTGDWAEHVFAEWPEDTVVRLADMNGNGRLDVVVTRSEGCRRVSWFESPADPRASGWAEHMIGDDVDYAHSLIVTDLTGDGTLDVVTAEMHQSTRRRVLVYLNRGDSVSWQREVLATTGSHNMAVADLGPDGMAVCGTNWSGDHQPVEMWVLRP